MSCRITSYNVCYTKLLRVRDERAQLAPADARRAEREMDVLVSSGEQVSAALLAIQLNELGVPARSLLV